MRSAIPVSTVLPKATKTAFPVKIGPLAERRLLVMFSAFSKAGANPGQALVGVSARAFRSAATAFNPGVGGGGAFFVIPTDGRTYGPFAIDRRQQIYAAATTDNGVILSAWIWPDVAADVAGLEAPDLAIGEMPAIGSEAPPDARAPAPDAPTAQSTIVPAIAQAVSAAAPQRGDVRVQQRAPVFGAPAGGVGVAGGVGRV